MKRSKAGRVMTVILAAGVLAAVGVVVLGRTYTGASYGGDKAEWVYVDSTMTEERLLEMLPRQLGNAGGKAAVLWRLGGGDMSRAAGAYRIDPGMTSLDIYRTISRGRQTPVKLTFNNVRTLGQLAARVGERMAADSASFVAACNDVLPAAGFKKPGYIAAFLPDTYEFYWTASPKYVVETLLKHRNGFWTDERRAKAKALGLSPVEVATVASIAEEETNDRAERAVVGRLYINRLDKGMKLQADPTVKYAVGDFSLRRITSRHLGASSRYNTYKYAGLPPGPIRMPEARTMDAILDSRPHKYLYMCAKEDFSGRHNFASDYATHQANAARYHKALNQRNIK